MAIRVQGERWFPDMRTFAEQMTDHWGDWYCDSEIATLRSVLMHRPGVEMEAARGEVHRQYRWKAEMDPALAQQQHDALADAYRANGVDVHYIEDQRPDRPNSIFVRDQVFMTPEGAIVARLGIEQRRGEERAAARKLAELGVPIIHTVNADGIFDGACGMWIDRRTVILGSGARANESGLRQVESELRNIGVETVLRFQIPYGHAHLDGLFNIADRDKVVCFPWQISYDLASALKDLGFDLIEATNLEEVKMRSAMNFVAVSPGHVIAPLGAHETHAKMEDAGIRITRVDISELQKGWGAVHCMTAFLKREPLDG